MVRAARDRRVIYVEEPVLEWWTPPVMAAPIDGVTVLTPRLPGTMPALAQPKALRELLDAWLGGDGVERPVLWYYTPMALPLDGATSTRRLCVYDCMDELAGFRGRAAGLLAPRGTS